MGLCFPTASPLPLPSLVILYWAAGNTCPTWPVLSRTEQKASSHLPPTPGGGDRSGAELPLEPRLVPGMLFPLWIFATCQTWDL